MKAPQLSLVLLTIVLSGAVALACKNGNANANGNPGASNGGPVALTSASMSVNVIANEKGFTPSSFELKQGAPATLIFRRTTDETCATQVVFPELKITKDLPLNVPVPIEVPTGNARTLTFQCGMGMFKGKAIIH